MNSLFRLKILSLLFLALTLAGCGNENVNPDSLANVQGTWNGVVVIDTCVPLDVCDSIQLPPGEIPTIIVLTQVNDRVQGTYAYNDAGISANVTGVVDGDRLSLSGTAIAPAGQATVQFAGTVDVGFLQANVEHRISLIDGRTATAAGSGSFLRQ
jgi:hypothetical protein